MCRIGTTKKHFDGTECLEGTRQVPRNFGKSVCCSQFLQHTSNCVFDLRFEWWPKSLCWMIRAVQGVGYSGIQLDFCPFCGERVSPPDCNECGGTGTGVSEADYCEACDGKGRIKTKSSVRKRKTAV